MAPFEQRICYGQYSPDDLQAWLQGLSLPLDGDRYEPFERLLNVLPTCGDPDSARVNLCHSLRDVLAQRPDTTTTAPLPETLLYNSLLLSARLACPEQLGELVYGIYKRQQAQQAPKFRAVLRHVLFDALIENQIGDRLEPLWNEVVESGRGDGGYFEARPQDGWDGLIRMVQADLSNWTTAVPKIAPALKILASHEPDPQIRREYLDHLVTPLLDLAGPVKPQSSQPKTKHRLIVDIADKGRWQTALVLSLNLYDSWTENDKHYFIVWTPVFQGIPQDDVKITEFEECCQGAVTQFAISKPSFETQTWIWQTSQDFEKRRLEDPYPSSHVTRGIIFEGWQAATENAKLLKLKQCEQHLTTLRSQTLRTLLHIKELKR